MEADIVIQLRDTFLAKVFEEERKQPNTSFQNTLEADPIQVGGLPIQPIVNFLRGSIKTVALNPAERTMTTTFTDAEVQLVIGHGDDLSDTLHTMLADASFTAPAGSKDEADESGVIHVKVGFDLRHADQVLVETNVKTGSPYDDDAFLAEVFQKRLQQAYENDDLPTANAPFAPPEVQEFPDGSPVLTAKLWAIAENDSGGNSEMVIRAQAIAPASGETHPRIRMVIPLQTRWANVAAAESSGLTLEPHMVIRAEVEISVPIERDVMSEEINVNTATGSQVSVDGITPLDSGAVSNLMEPVVELIVRQAILTIGREIAEAMGDQSDPYLTLSALNEHINKSAHEAVTADEAFIAFWEQPESDLILNATPVVLEHSLAIGLNGETFSHQEVVPEGHEFAVVVMKSRVLGGIDGYLYSHAHYDDADGDLEVAGAGQFGDTLTIRGFTKMAGRVRKSTRLELNRIQYVVEADSDIVNGQATLSLDKGLKTVPSDGDRVSVQFGYGLPDRCFDPNQRDWVAKEVCIHEVDTSLADGHLQLDGKFTVHRRALISKLGGKFKAKLGFGWEGTASVDGGSQSGHSLNVKAFSHRHQKIGKGSQFVLDGQPRVFTVTADASLQDDRASLGFVPALQHSPDDGAQVLLLWVARGSVSGIVATRPGLILRGVDEGKGLIPAQAAIEFPGAAHPERTVAKDAVVSLNGNAEVELKHSIVEDKSPVDGSAVRIQGGWHAISYVGEVDGTQQSGKIVKLRNMQRVINRGVMVRVISGKFLASGLIADMGEHRVVEEAPIVGDAADLHFADQEVVREASWYEDAIVTVSDRRQDLSQHEKGKPDVTLGTGGVAEAIVAFIVFVVTQGVWFGIIAGVVSHALRVVIQNLTRREVSKELSSTIDLPLASELRKELIRVENYFANPVRITPSSITLIGRSTVTSQFAHLDYSQARANGPYGALAGHALDLEGGLVADRTDYLWVVDDEHVYLERNASHVYPQMGDRIADLTTFNHQFGSDVEPVLTRQLARVTVRNVVPEVQPLAPVSGYEGEEVEVTAAFADRAWLDRHSAYFVFGDGSLPVQGTVVETNVRPLARGTARARHTYCDNGVFDITVVVVDEHGGTAVGETIATIENVAPVVRAGDDMFAHPCVPIRFVGYFEDQGWCDTHTGKWDFGDCSAVFPAAIVQTNEPPRATGHAIANHCYTQCGTFIATLTIRDDDGAEASDWLVVRSSDVVNGSFEEGFKRERLGLVANGWTPYARARTSAIAEEDVFHCETCVVCSGQRAQAIIAPDFAHAGLRQTLGANEGWEYQVVADVSVQSANAAIWLGVDPIGGVDREGSTVVWSNVGPQVGWQRLSVRAVAAGPSVTVFLEVRDPAVGPAIFDCVSLQAYPCTVQLVSRPWPDRESRCVSWLGEPVSGSVSTREGLTFSSISGAALASVTFGMPQGLSKLLIPNQPDGLRIQWEGEAYKVCARAFGPASSKISLSALNGAGDIIGQVTEAHADIRTLTIEEPGILGAELRSEHRGTLLEVCVERIVRADARGRTSGMTGTLPVIGSQPRGLPKVRSG